MIIAGIAQLCIAPVLIIARRPIVEWLATNVPPLDVAWFHVRGELVVALAGISGAISGGMFVGGAALSVI